jgi:hypothetical protein
VSVDGTGTARDAEVQPLGEPPWHCHLPLLGVTVASVDSKDLTEGELGRDGGRRQPAASSNPLSDELAAIELLLRFAIPGSDVQADAALLIETFGTLDGVLAAAPEDLSQLPGMNDAPVTLLKLVDWISRMRGAAATASTTDSTDAEDARSSAAREIHPSVPFELATPIHQLPTVQLDLMLVTTPRPSVEPKTGGTVKAIQDVLLAEGSLAVKLSVDCQSLEQLQDVLLGKLGQNSVETRRRYVQSITRWFFSDGFNGILRRAWLAYEDDAILSDLLRWSFLQQEPVMAASVAKALFPLENGIAIPATYFDKFLADYFGEAPPEKTRERLKTNLKKLGFLERGRGKADRLAPVVPQKTSFLILLHHLFAVKSVRTVELRHLFTNPFWKLLGYKSDDTVRSLLREADASGAIAKYIVADQLEQVTTCFAFDELLERKVRL